MNYLERQAAKRILAERESQRQAWLDNQRHKVEPAPERLTGPSLRAAMDAATSRPPAYCLTGDKLYQEILDQQRYHPMDPEYLARKR